MLGYSPKHGKLYEFQISVMEETESWSELSVQELIEKKDSIEAEIKAQNDILEGVSERCVPS